PSVQRRPQAIAPPSAPHTLRLIMSDPRPTAIYILYLHAALPISLFYPILLPRAAIRYERLEESARHHRAYETLAGEAPYAPRQRSEEHTSELQSLTNLVCRLMLEKKKTLRQDRQNRFRLNYTTST